MTKPILTLIVSVIVVGIAFILGYVGTRPDTFRYERSVIINTPAEKIFGLINDFNQWKLWSPYEQKDPAMKRTFGAITSGVGGNYAWDGNNEVGAGRMEILESNVPSLIKIKLEFFRPLKAINTAEFTLKKVDSGVEVRWAMYGDANFISKLMGLFFNVDAMVGKDFEQGLSELKRKSETSL